MAKPIKAWWDGLEPIYEDAGDGQQFAKTYARKTKDKWEYAVVTLSDDHEFISAMILNNGKARYVEADEVEFPEED